MSLLKFIIKREALIFVCIFLFCLLALEIILRANLFTHYVNLPNLKNVGVYASAGEDDYWKIYFREGGKHGPPNAQYIHPIIAATRAPRTPENPLGLTPETIQQLSSPKNKILFFGDSFVQGAAKSPQNYIHNYMTDRLTDTVVVDLSMSGYGLDQMYIKLLMTHKMFANPHIFIGVYVDDDLDRSMLSVRTLQKPRFIIENGELRLTNVPVVPDQIKYFKDHPPQIISYLYRCITRGILYNRYKLFANQIEKIDTKKKINAKIIEAINDLAHKENYPLTFVLFYSNVSLLWDVWQEQFLKDELTRLNIPYVDTKNVLLEYLSNHPDGILDLYEPSSHHIDLGNQIIGDLLLNYLKQHNIK